MKRTSVFNLTGSALCLALSLVLPTIFHLFGPGTGTAFLPMHIPVLLCGLLFGWQYGAACGFIAPLLSSILTGMPHIFPIAVAMSFELCAYGLLAGLFYKKLKLNIFMSLFGAMLGGRVIMGIANAIFLGVAGRPYGFTVFITGAFVTALPGIVIQIITIPLIIFSLERAGVIKFKGD